MVIGLTVGDRTRPAARAPDPRTAKLTFSGLLAVCVLALCGCATPGPQQMPVAPQTVPLPPPPGFTPYEPRPAAPEAHAREDSPARLEGWTSEDTVAAFDAYLAGCGVARSTAARFQCARALDIQRVSRPVTPERARQFFETGFSLVAVATPDGRPGLLTSYFAPEYPRETRARR